MVIQRLQNLYLFIAAILMAIFAFVPFIELTTPEILGEIPTGKAEDSLLALSPYSISWGMFAINICVCVLLLLTVLNFKNLKLQKKMSFISLIITLCYIVSISIVSILIINTHNCEWSLLLSAAIPVVTIIFIVLAISGIMKDVRILSSYDRIR